MMVATTSTTLTQATSHNISVLNEKVMEAKSKNQKLKDEIIYLREEMKKRRKADDHLVPIKENILEKQEHLHYVKVEFFMEIQKMEDKIKYFKKHIDISSHINQKMESLWIKVEEMDRWRNMEKIIPSVLLGIKAYDIRLHTLATKECQ